MATEDDPLIGTLVGERYRVARRLGEGGMGTVYVAVHESLRKEVAIKILSTTGKVDRESLARFEREAITSANLKHPNIAEATDFGQLPGGGLYLVMEYIEGTTLRGLLNEHGKLPPARAIAILQQVAAALATAHARGVVHRDLKPENVVVTAGPASGGGEADELVKVIDFGIAKLRSATFGAGATGLTRAGTVFGTPEYMSPEQVMGQAVDRRSDQYALGVLAFELLTGKPPYKAEDVGQLMMMHVGAPVPSTREQTPALPPAIDAVTTRMLAKLPDERFDSVTDAIEALASALSEPSAQPAIAAPAIEIPATPPARVTAPETTLRSPGNELAVPARSVRWRPRLVLGVGAAITLAGVAGVALFAGSSDAPAPLGPEPSAAIAEAGIADQPPDAQPRAGIASATSVPPITASATAAARTKPAPVSPAAPTVTATPSKGKGKGKEKHKKD